MCEFYTMQPYLLERHFISMAHLSVVFMPHLTLSRIMIGIDILSVSLTLSRSPLRLRPNPEVHQESELHEASLSLGPLR